MPYHLAQRTKFGLCCPNWALFPLGTFFLLIMHSFQARFSCFDLFWSPWIMNILAFLLIIKHLFLPPALSGKRKRSYHCTSLQHLNLMNDHGVLWVRAPVHSTWASLMEAHTCWGHYLPSCFCLIQSQCTLASLCGVPPHRSSAFQPRNDCRYPNEANWIDLSNWFQLSPAWESRTHETALYWSPSSMKARSSTCGGHMVLLRNFGHKYLEKWYIFWGTHFLKHQKYTCWDYI